MRRIALVLSLSVLACPKKPPPPAPPPPPPDPKAELKATVAALYSSLEHQEPERLNELLTADVLAYGLGPKDSFADRDTLIETMRQQLIPFGLRGDVFKVASSAPKLALASEEQSGWFYDSPRFERVRQGKASQFWKVRVTGHAIRVEGHWRIDALHVSFAWPDTELYAPDAPKRLKPPDALGAAKGRDSDELIGLARRMLDDIGLKIDRTSDADETVLIGTDPQDVFEGGTKFKALARPRLPELKKAIFTLTLEDGPRARLAPDRKSGWVSGVVVLRVGKGAKQQTLPAFRALWLYAQQKEQWELVSEHQSIGLPDELRKPASDAFPDPAPDAGSPAR